MVIVRIQGGLGNQLFQYALARSLSQRTGQPFKLDFTSYGHDELRKPGLRSFRASLPVAGRLEISRLKYGLGEHFLAKLMRREPTKGVAFIQEKTHSYDASILSLKDPAYLDGYWQSEKYFHDFGDLIRSELVLREGLPEASRKWEEKIRDCESISIHVRRGDYVANPANHSIFSVCSPGYYFRSAELVASSFPNARFFLFSDDPNWVRENLVPKLGGKAEVMAVSADPAQDMYLMSRCRHNIIANSSFSWWAAWLNPNPGKIVVAPSEWFKQAERESPDLIPREWKRLS